MAANKKNSGKNTGAKKSSSAKKTSSRAGTSKKTRSASSTGTRKTVKKTGGNTSAKTGAVRSSGRTYNDTRDPMMNTEVLCWCLLGASVLIFICVLGFGGRLGDAFGDLLFGVMGTNAYLFPFMLFFLTIYMTINRGNHVAVIRTLSVAALFCILCGIWQLLNYGDMTSISGISDYFALGQQYHAGGGVIGGALIMFFSPTVGLVGTWAVFLIAVFLFLALITQKTLFINTGRRGSEAVEARRARAEEIRQERSARRQAEKEARRAEAETRRALREMELAREESSDSISPVFLSVLKKDTGAGEEQSPEQDSGPKFTTDLFGDTKKSRAKRTRMPAITPDQVVFGSVETEQPPSGKIITSFDAEPVKTDSRAESREKPARSGGKTTPFVRIKTSDRASSEDADQETVSVRPASGEHMYAPEVQFETEHDPARLSDSFVIHRAQSAVEEMPEDEPDTAAPVVTRKDIEDAGVSRSKKKADEETAKVSMTREQTQKEVDSVTKEIEAKEMEEEPYEFPSTSLLEKVPRDRGGMSDEELRETASKLQQILATFGVNAQVTNVSCGPSVTRYELMPELGTKVSKITNLADDIKLNLAAADIRIEAPIPGKAAVGIEVPNEKTATVYLKELIESDEFRKHKSKLAYVVGKDIAGRIVVSDIAKMPHLLIAGATGSGKSVFINTLVMSILFNADPSEVKMIMIDPKVVELSVYNGIPHLFIPVVTDPKKAAGALNWAVAEMTRRYEQFAACGVRNLAGYNARVETLIKNNVPDAPKKMPQIVIIVDELADLMMVSGNEVEDAICRLAQLARACGIHLVIATQRPSVDVITGLIKANIPSRIAFAVSSGTDSRTILDMNGAEKLLGNGDMLFSPQTYKKPVRVQGAFVSDEEIQRVVDSIRRDDDSPAGQELMKKRMQEIQAATASSGGAGSSDSDELFADAGRFIIQKDKASIGMLQRWFKIGFNRAARIMDQLSDAGVVGPDEGTKPRKVLMSEEQFENYLEQN